MKRRMSTIGIAAVLLLASFALTAFTTGGEETSVNPNPNGAQAGLQQPLDQGGPFEFDGALPISDIGLEDAVFSPSANEMADIGSTFSDQMSWRSDYYSTDLPTRASDEEREQDVHDFPNGSKLTSAAETIDGTLTYDPDNVDSDWKDWYKFAVTDINELADTINGIRNASVSLESYTDGSDGYDDLYEYTYEESNDGRTMISEFGDFLDINLLYFDPWAGYVDMGNSEFRFDDTDDTDGWTWAQNWSTYFFTPVNSDGDEDPDGFANGHTEVGWYYVGIALNFYIRDQTWNRDLFTVKYSLNIDTTDQVDTDQGSNSREDAQPYGGNEPVLLHSRLNQVDWYKMEGSDPNKIWNISFTLDRQAALALWLDYPDNTLFLDNWLWTFVVWRGPGDDGEWDTGDEIWIYDYVILTFSLEGGRLVSNAEQNLSFTYRSWDTSNPEREVYIGIVMEPMMIKFQGQDILYYYYCDYVSACEYALVIDITEEIPNHPPTLSELEISSDWPGHKTGGHFGTNFYFNITYTDEDNDPPVELNIVFDPDVPFDEKIFDMLQYEVDSGDTDYTDGKEYSYLVLGEDLEEYLVPPVIMVNATDTIPIESMRIQGFSGNFYYNNTLYVWDDDPVYLNPAYDGEETLTEDIEDSFQLQGMGLIVDPEDRYFGFQAWNVTAGEWKTDYDSDLFNIKVEQNSGIWEAVVTPKPDQNGEETVTFRGFDEHSNVTGAITIIVEPENDLPMVKSVKIDGTTYDVDNSRPDFPEIHLESQVTVKQDKEIIIELNVEDIDNEASELIYSFRESQSDNWKGPIEVDENTGEITLTPINNDIRMDNSEIKVSIDDGGAGIVILTIYLQLTDVNDKPTIQLSSALKTVYEREEEITIAPTISDMDPGSSMTVSINMLEEVGGVEPIVDQLPNAEFVKDLDWTFNENIGRFTLKLDDWMIWKGPYGFVNMVNITVVLEVEDNHGAKNSVEIILTLTSDPPPPPPFEDVPLPSHSVYDDHLDTPNVIEGKRVKFTISGDVVDIFGNEFVVQWEYNGSVISDDNEFDYEFDSYGTKIVYIYYEFDNVQTEKRSVNIKLTAPPPPPPEPKGPEGGNGWIIPVVVIVIILLIIAVLIALFIVMRKKQQPMEADQEYYDETPRFGGRGHSQELGAQPHTRGLSPGRESEHTEKLPPRRGVSSGMSCPNCGSSVQKDWFLCPECKNPLD